MLHADQRLKQNHKEENLPALPQEQFLLRKRTWTDVELAKYSLSDYEVSKKLIHKEWEKLEKDFGVEPDQGQK